MEEEATTLECGASLSEQAHLAQMPSIGGADDSIQQSPMLPSTTRNANSIQQNTIENLRSSIAEDVLTSATTYSSLTMFASPLEDAHGNKLPLPLVYCDQTASNRPLQSMETYLQKECLSLYGNTHTNTSITGSQSTAFCAEARQLVAEACNAKTTGKASLDVVLFA
jgi:hypothetical protein